MHGLDAKLGPQVESEAPSRYVPLGLSTITYAELRGYGGKLMKHHSCPAAALVGHWPDLSPATKGNQRPGRFHKAERPSSLQEAVSRTERTRASERQHVPMAAVLQGVADQHGGDSKQAKGSKCVHPTI